MSCHSFLLFGGEEHQNFHKSKLFDTHTHLRAMSEHELHGFAVLGNDDSSAVRIRCQRGLSAQNMGMLVHFKIGHIYVSIILTDSIHIICV